MSDLRKSVHGITPTDPQQRLLARRFINPTGCWEWFGCKNNQGYGQIGIGSKVDGTRRVVLTHRLSATIWKDFDFESPLEVLHACDNPACFNPDHLFQGTHLDNMRDCRDKGRYNAPRGTRNGRSKLDPSKVRQIRLLKQDGVTYSAIAREFGTGMTAIRQVIGGTTWRDVK